VQFDSVIADFALVTRRRDHPRSRLIHTSQPMKTHIIEPLESRIAPATFVTYIDIDGDRVKITASAGTLDSSLLALTSGDPTIPGQLKALELGIPDFAGANITFTVTKKPGGDGFADVGYIHANNTDLGNVTVKGDLGKIVSGNGNETDGPSLKTLSVRSLGRFGLSTQGGVGDLVSTITGRVAALKVSGDIKDAAFQVTGSIGSIAIGGSLAYGNLFSTGDMGPVKIGHDILGAGTDNFGLVQSTAKLTRITVGGSVLGGTAAFTGAIRAAELGPVKIARDVIGGSGIHSGSITSSVGDIASVAIGGSLLGGSASDSGRIESEAGNLGPLKIAHDVRGGSGPRSGSIEARLSLKSAILGGSLIGGSNSETGFIFSWEDMGAIKIGQDVQGGSGGSSGGIANLIGALTSVTIGGSLIGGSAQGTGEISSFKGMGPVKIAHDLIGGSVTGAASLEDTGIIFNHAGHIASITIGGSIISGIDTSSGFLHESGTIRAGEDIGSLTVKGSLIGNSIGDDSPVIITAVGSATPTATVNLAIGKITIGGRVEFAQILAGFNEVRNPIRASAQIGPVSIGGDWIASSIVAGVENYGANGIDDGGGSDDNLNFGDANDHIINNAADSIAKIASIKIKGRVIGSATAGDHFGFVSHTIGSFKAGGVTVPLTAGPANNLIQLSLNTADVTIREV
jgi:hypothetical protein